MALHQEIYDAGQEMARNRVASPSELLGNVLGRFLGKPFEAMPGIVVDSEGNSTDAFACVVCAKSEDIGPFDTDGIPADATAAVIDACEAMDLESFRNSYRRVAAMKKLKKTAVPPSEETTRTTATMGIIFSLRSSVPLDDLAEEVSRLNSETPSREWPDMVAVLATGVINYAAQFPGESLSGDFLPPALGALIPYPPPMYILIVVRPTVDYTLNKVLSFLIAHLSIFRPDAELPDWAQILEGVPQNALTKSGFQYNLAGNLLPVPRQFYSDRYLPPLPMRIEDQSGKLLCTLQFLPWQDGGTILLRGKLPLDGLLLFLGKAALERVQVFRRPDLQISSVLPIRQEHFYEMLKLFQRRSNMIVRRDQTKWVVQKLGDEGSQSPFMARLFIGIGRIRDAAYPDPATRVGFDKCHELVTSNLLTARLAADRIDQLLEEHTRKVSLGLAARLQGQAIHIEESIDKELRMETESFVNAAVRAVKQGMQDLAKEAHVNIGFLFKKQAAFDKGVASLRTTDPFLAAYLLETRSWSERLLKSRNDIEHSGWMLPRVSYSRISDRIEVKEPSVSEQPVTEFVRFMLDRVCCFAEEITVHCLQRKLPAGIAVTEIPPLERSADVPERFALTLLFGGQPTWHLHHQGSTFDSS